MLYFSNVETKGIAFSPTFSRHTIIFTSFHSLLIQRNNVPFPGEIFEIVPSKKPVSNGAFWYFGGTRHGRNNTVGQSRRRRDSVPSILTFALDTWDWPLSS